MGISPLGWLHTLGSLPAIPLAAYMLVRHGRIVPGTRAGRAYFWFMLLGVLTVYPIAHQPISSVIATVTLAVLLLGYGISKWPMAKRSGKYIETISLSISVFLLMVPTVSESLRRLPVGDPLVTDLKDPLLLGVQGALFLALIVGIPLQMRALYKRKAVQKADS
jgi:Sec-independent protein secretion pathway component TatC